MAVADRHGLPVAVSVERARPHEVKLAESTLARRNFFCALLAPQDNILQAPSARLPRARSPILHIRFLLRAGCGEA